MKKVISLFLVLALLASMLTIAASAYSVSDEGALSAKEAIAAVEEEEGEEIETQRIYFQMPNGNRGAAADADVSVHKEVLDEETGDVIDEYDEVVLHAGDKAPTWYSDYNIVDGQNYAGVYWWGGTAACDSWAGYRAEIEDYEQGIYYVDVPTDVVIMIWNNGVDGGTDTSADIYYEAAQTVDTNIEGAYEGDYDSLPYGSPNPDLFDGCIYIIDPNQVSINALSQKQTCGANWYVYYGDGCYGQEFKDGIDYDVTDGWSDDVADICMNPDHFVNGVHVGYHEDVDVHTHDLTYVAEVPATTEAEGVKAHYVCSGCDKLFLDAEGTQEVTAEDLVIEKLVEFVPDPTKLYFDASTTGWTLGKSDKIGFYVFGKDGELLPWGGKKLNGTAVKDQDGLWEYDPAAKGMNIEEGEQYKIIFTGGSGNQTYDLIFDTTCFGHIAYCDGTEYENPVDSSQKALAAFWKDIDPAKYGPVLQISSIGTLVGTCFEEGATAETVFSNFLVNTLANARLFKVDTGETTEQDLIDNIGNGLKLTKQQAYDAIAATGTETTWDYTVSTLPSDVVVPHTHTPGEPVIENEKAATCEDEGSYDEVVYCADGDGYEISRETKTTPALGHDLTLVAEVPATEDSNGVQAHYVCSRCGKLFADATASVEVTAEDLVIPALPHTHVPGDAVIENEKAATCTAEGSYDEVVYCTVCGEELSRDTKTVAKIAHTPGEEVYENEVVDHDSTTRDVVVYCTVCGEEIRRIPVADPIITHTLTYVAEVPATTTTEGVKAHYECTVCGELFSDRGGNYQVTAADLVIPVIAGILGDVDNDGEVDIVDATLIQRIVLNIITADAGMTARGDVDGDGLDIVDATRIQRFLLAIDDGFGIGQAVK